VAVGADDEDTALLVIDQDELSAAERARIDAEREARRARRERARAARAGRAAPGNDGLPFVLRRPRDEHEEEDSRPPERLAGRGSASLPALPRLRRPSGRTLALLAGAAIVAGTLVGGLRLLAPDLEASGPDSAMIGSAAAAELAFSVRADPDVLAQARWTIDGLDVTSRARIRGDRSTLRAAKLPDGTHTVRVHAPGPLPGTDASKTWTIGIDRTPPELVVDPKSTRARAGEPVTIRGSVDERATVTANGREARVEDGRFAVELAEPPAQPVELVAVDEAGNRVGAAVPISLVPRRPPFPLRSIHVTFYAWRDREARAGILRLIEEGRINSVELDLKDESGIVGFDADVPFARRIGAVDVVYDLEQAIELLHSKGAWVIGRVVAFRDPIHAAAAWKRGWRDQVVQTPSGAPYAGYGGFTNFANPQVRRYNIEIARRAAEAGIDDILYDYIRRPDGPRSTMRFPGLRGTPERSVASFLGEARRALRPYGTFLGASVFGVAASRPTEVAQSIPAMARNADYIAPMLYPSHWGPGEYGVANPNAQPYDIIKASLRDFQRAVEGTGARVVPWLQDFSLGHTYGPAEVRAQIRAGADIGINEWILWNAETIYTEAALDRHRPGKPLETKKHEPQPPAPPAGG
jgi:hypothetical protein